MSGSLVVEGLAGAMDVEVTDHFVQYLSYGRVTVDLYIQ